MSITESSEDYLPARRLNEFVYCPRLFYYEQVEGLFADNLETVEGSIRHARVDARDDALPKAEDVPDDERLHARSVTLSSDELGLIAKLDLIESDQGRVVPVDYKRGRPRIGDDGAPEVWEPERVQLAAQALVLRAHGYRCDEGVIYFCATRQRVRVPIDEPLAALTLARLAEAKRTAEARVIPPPLEDSPKCPRCSLVGICLPDETALLRRAREAAPPSREVRRLVPARDDRRPLYLNSQGFRVGKSGEVLQVRDKEKLVHEAKLIDTSQVNLFGNVQITTQAVQTLCEADVPVAYFSQGGWFYGVTQGFGAKNVDLRREQFRKADDPAFCLDLARRLVAGKIKNQRVLLQRNHREPPPEALVRLKASIDDAEGASSLERLLGIEGYAARIYFEHFAGMIKLEEPGRAEARVPTGFDFRFDQRNRRPPRDPVNAMLSLAYSLLAKDVSLVARLVGLDPLLGYYHQPRFGRPALALDLMEPFRPLIADSVVLTAINTRMVTERDFIRTGEAVALTPGGRKGLFRAYEQRMDHLATHPLFSYRASYRRLLEIQTRLLARVLSGELADYPVFVTR